VLASEADLNLMEKKKITSIVVVDEANGVLGVVHLHDLWTLIESSRRLNSLVPSRQKFSAEGNLLARNTRQCNPCCQATRKPHQSLLMDVGWNAHRRKRHAALAIGWQRARNQKFDAHDGQGLTLAVTAACIPANYRAAAAPPLRRRCKELDITYGLRKTGAQDRRLRRRAAKNRREGIRGSAFLGTTCRI